MITSPHWKKLKQIIVNECDVEPSRVTPEASLMELVGPGLNVGGVHLLEIFMQVEEEFGISISDEVAYDTKTVGDLLAYLDEHVT